MNRGDILAQRFGSIGRFSALKAAALVVVLFLAVYVPAFVTVGLWMPRAAAAVPTTIGITFAMTILLMLAWQRSWRGLAAFGFRFCAWRHLLVAVGFGVPLAIALTRIAQLVPADNPLGGGLLAPWMTILYFLILAPISEETIFRGLLQTAMAKVYPGQWGVSRIRMPAAVLCIAVLFGLIHLKLGVLTAVVAFFLGLLAGELRQRSDSLLPAFLVHSIFNAAAMLWTLK